MIRPPKCFHCDDSYYTPLGVGPCPHCGEPETEPRYCEGCGEVECVCTSDPIEKVVAAQNFGTATAIKCGRRPEWPYVPIIDHGTHTEQLRGLAYATRFEAVERAQKAIIARRETFIRHLRDPRWRALREQHGLPQTGALT